MRYRKFGSTGIEISEIGFGCGNVGGLMIRGSHAEQVADKLNRLTRTNFLCAFMPSTLPLVSEDSEYVGLPPIQKCSDETP